MDETTLYRKLEQLLLEPSVERRKISGDELLQLSNVRHLEELINIIMYATECDVYRGINSLDAALGKNALIDADDLSDCTSSMVLFDHLAVRIVKFMESNAKNGLEPIYVMAGVVLFLNIFIRVNWTGPPICSTTPSEKHLASQYRNKAVDSENDDDVCLDNLDHMPSDINAFAAYASEKIADEYNERSLLKSPDIKCFDVLGDKSNYSLLVASILEELQIDGEAIYTGIAAAPYFIAAIAFLSTINGYLSHSSNTTHKEKQYGIQKAQVLTTVGIWQARLAFTWQRIVRSAMFNPCQTLYKCCVKDLGEILKVSGILPADFSLSLNEEELSRSLQLHSENDHKLLMTDTRDASPRKSVLERVIAKESISSLVCSHEMGALLIVELALRLPYYNMNKLHDPLLVMASSVIGFSYSFTGRLGIRRKYQMHQIAQLVLVREQDHNQRTHKEIEDSTSEDHVSSSASVQTNEHKPDVEKSGENVNNIPENIGLLDVNDDTDILERPKLSEEADDSPLTATEQCILLCKALHILNTAPEGDELNLEFLNAIVVRCLGKEGHGLSWLLAAVALWVRCKTEYHRTKTVERATLQLYKLSDSYYEREASVCSRLEYVWHAWCPSSWGIKREICRRMCSIGSFLTAYEIYRKLHLWEDAIQCLIIVGRKNDAKELVLSQLETYETPLLWCFLGDIEGNISHYNKAWEVSKGRCARAQRTLGSYHFNKGELQKSVEALELALAINPMRESTQFLLGCSYLKLGNLERALGVFSRVVALNPTSHDAWANMCSAHVNVGFTLKAIVHMTIQMNKFKEAGLCIEQAIKHCPNKWQFWEIRLSISVRSRDVQGVCLSVEKLIQLGKQSSVKPPVMAFLVDSSTRLNKAHSTHRMIARTLEFLTKHITDDPDIWSLYARYFSFQKLYDDALDCALRQYRSIEKKIAGSLAEVKPDADQQREHDVTHMRRLTACLGDMVMLLKRLMPSSRREKRDTVVQTLKSVRERFRARTEQVNEQFLSEMDSMIENADVEDIIAVYEGELNATLDIATIYSEQGFPHNILLEHMDSANVKKAAGCQPTDPASRMFIMGIPQRMSSESLRSEIEQYGDVEVYLCENSTDDNGWAFVGFTNRAAVERVCNGVKGYPASARK